MRAERASWIRSVLQRYNRDLIRSLARHCADLDLERPVTPGRKVELWAGASGHQYHRQPSTPSMKATAASHSPQGAAPAEGRIAGGRPIGNRPQDGILPHKLADKWMDW